jgi:hypothetical protein
MRTLHLALTALILVMAAPRAGAGEASLPVLVGGNARFDACMTVAEITGLDPNGDGFLSVRSGPGGRPYSEIDRVYNRDQVWICDRGHSPWYAVVYDRTGRLNCGVGSVRPVRGPYRGPCRSGWIHSRYVRDIAG